MSTMNDVSLADATDTDVAGWLDDLARISRQIGRTTYERDATILGASWHWQLTERIAEMESAELSIRATILALIDRLQEDTAWYSHGSDNR